jgi:hypothetical protein
MKLPELNSFNDREAKPLNISLHIGRRPLLAFGNSDGDLPMLRYAKFGPGARLALMLRHDDAEREVAYDREFRLSPLVEALDKAGEYGITWSPEIRREAAVDRALARKFGAKSTPARLGSALVFEVKAFGATGPKLHSMAHRAGAALRP